MSYAPAWTESLPSTIADPAVVVADPRIAAGYPA